MTPLQLIIDTMLPGDPSLGMPSASEIGVDTCLKQKGLECLVNDFITMVDEVSAQKHGHCLGQLQPEQRLQVINACKLVNVRLFSEMLSQLLRAYYTNPRVLVAVGAGSVPPFPGGNALGSDDWSVLEPVFLRGPIYREVS